MNLTDQQVEELASIARDLDDTLYAYDPERHFTPERQDAVDAIYALARERGVMWAEPRRLRAIA